MTVWQSMGILGGLSQNTYKVGKSRRDSWEYGFPNFGLPWKHLIGKYLVNATADLANRISQVVDCEQPARADA